MSRTEDINWSLIGNGAIWGDSPEELMERWLNLTRNQELSDEISADGVLSKAVKRAAAVRKYLDLPEGKLMKTPRQWETAWNVTATRDRLTACFKKMECVVTIAERRGMGAHELSARYPTGERVIVIEKWVAEERAQRLKDAGLRLPFGEDEGVLLLLAEDLYTVAAEQMGHQPAAWVDEIGRYFFSQQLFGWPFNPVVSEVAG